MSSDSLEELGPAGPEGLAEEGEELSESMCPSVTRLDFLSLLQLQLEHLSMPDLKAALQEARLGAPEKLLELVDLYAVFYGLHGDGEAVLTRQACEARRVEALYGLVRELSSSVLSQDGDLERLEEALRGLERECEAGRGAVELAGIRAQTETVRCLSRSRLEALGDRRREKEEYAEETRALKAQVSLLTEEIAEMKQERETREMESQQEYLKAQKECLEQDLQALGEQFQQEQDENERLYQQLVKTQETAEGFKRQARVAEAKKSEWDRAVDALREKMISMQAESKEALAQRAEIEGQLKQAQTALRAAQARAQFQEMRAEQLQKALDKAKAAELVEAENQRLKEELQAAREQLETGTERKQLTECQRKLQQEAEASLQLKEDISQLKQQLTYEMQERQRLEIAVENQAANLAGLKETRAAEAESYRECIRQLEARLASTIWARPERDAQPDASMCAQLLQVSGPKPTQRKSVYQSLNETELHLAESTRTVEALRRENGVLREMQQMERKGARSVTAASQNAAHAAELPAGVRLIQLIFHPLIIENHSSFAEQQLVNKAKALLTDAFQPKARRELPQLFILVISALLRSQDQTLVAAGIRQCIAALGKPEFKDIPHLLSKIGSASTQ